MEVKLVKEPDNEYDKEAIKAEVEGLGLVKYVLPRGVLCEMVLNCEENGGEE